MSKRKNKAPRINMKDWPKARTATHRPHMQVKLLFIGVAIVSLAFYFIWSLDPTATTHQPERYSELYFTTPAKLPSQVSPARAVPVDFTVHNAESERFGYIYHVVFTSPLGKTSLLTHGSFFLANNATSHIKTSVHLRAFVGRGEVSVVIQNQPESIHFWVEDTTK